VEGDDKNKKSVQCIVFMITGGILPSIKEMTKDEFGFGSMENIDPEDLRMSSKMWEKRGLVSIGKTLEHTSLYGTDHSDNENADSESMMKMFLNLPAGVITQAVSRIHEEFSKFFCSKYFQETLEEKDSPLAQLHGIQKCFIIIQNRCVGSTGNYGGTFEIGN
jgi:hypothetical protein